MAFEGLKDKLKDQLADLNSKIQENSTFNNLREKFEAQPPTIQRAILAGALVLVALFMLSFPYSYISTSQEYLNQFEENRGLIQGLLRASRSAKEPSPLPPPSGPDMLRGRVENALKENRLVPDQIGEIQALPDSPAKDLAPKAVVQTGVAVQVKKLNLEQIVAIGHTLQNLGPGIKLMGLEILQSAGQTHYYDMVARVVAFALPQMNFDNEPETKAGKRGANANKRKAETTTEENPE